MIYFITYWTANLFLRVALKFKVFGQRNIPRQGAFLFASNHVSNLDPVIMGSVCTRKTAFFAKEELFQKKILGWWLKGCWAFPVRRGKGDRAALKQAIDLLKNGRPLVFFPQGTRVRTGEQENVFPGAGFLVAKTGVPVVPVYIHGSDKAMAPGTKKIRRAEVNVHIGEPVSFPEGRSYEEISQGIMDAIYKLSPQ